MGVNLGLLAIRKDLRDTAQPFRVVNLGKELLKKGEYEIIYFASTQEEAEALIKKHKENNK